MFSRTLFQNLKSNQYVIVIKIHSGISLLITELKLIPLIVNLKPIISWNWLGVQFLVSLKLRVQFVQPWLSTGLGITLLFSCKLVYIDISHLIHPKKQFNDLS